MDELETVNDQRCHAVGDALLRRAGEVLAKAILKPYQAAHIGGGEFAVLMPGPEVRDAETVADSIMRHVELNNQFYGGPKQSFSIGYASCAEGENMEAMLRDADAAMYEAKCRPNETSRTSMETETADHA